ncbi:MAG: hypothetical protein AAGF01_12520 [Cyanobacteria bacterium P01_G01_bin.38]
MRSVVVFALVIALGLGACSAGDRDALRKAGELPQRLEQEDSP